MMPSSEFSSTAAAEAASGFTAGGATYETFSGTISLSRSRAEG